MVEPVSLTAAAIATLAFTKFLESGSGELGKKFTSAAIAKMEQLRQKIWEKLRGKAKAENALAAVEKQGSQAELGRVTVYLQDEMDDDPQFAAEVQTLAQQIEAGKLKDNSIMVQNIHDQAKGWQTKVEGGTAYIGEINQYGHDKPSSPFRSTTGKVRIIGAGKTIGTSNTTTAPKLLCYLHASVKERVVVNQVTTLDVTLSREALDLAFSATTKGGSAVVDPAKQLLIQIIPKTNFDFQEGTEDRIKLAPPTEGRPYQLIFDLIPTHVGEGEIWVVMRQGQVSLLTLILKPQIVSTKAETANSGSLNVSEAATEASPLTEPLHQLRIIEKRNGSQVSYQYELQSPSLNILGSYESKPIIGERSTYIKNLFNRIESRWLSNKKDDVEAFNEALRGFGGELYDELFPTGLQQQLWEHHDEIKSIMVLSTEPFIPWELIHLKPPGQNYLPDETCFLGQMGLVRWLYEGGWPPERMKIRDNRIRYVIPRYPDNRYRLPQAEQETQFLEETFQATAVEPQFTSIKEVLKSGGFDLLHYAGHGQAEQSNIAQANLMLQGRIEGDRYIPAYFSSIDVEQQFRLQDKDNRPLVVLNACQIGREGYHLTGVGGFAHAFLKAGAGAFVGTLWSIGDTPARVFTETFYQGLLQGLNLSEATIRARTSARDAGDATWLAYAVYGHPYLRVTRQYGSVSDGGRISRS